jgi:hypothetical protein
MEIANLTDRYLLPEVFLQKSEKAGSRSLYLSVLLGGERASMDLAFP